MKSKFQLLGLMLIIFLLYGIVGHMEYKQDMREKAWANSVQALELEQEKIQLEIEETREKLLKAEEQIRAHNLLIWDIRDRLHLDLELQLEEEEV